MKKNTILMTVIAAALFLNACKLTAPIAVSENPIGSKIGMAERTVWFGLAIGHTNVGIQAAAKNGGITKVATVDYAVKGGLFKTTYTTTVTGE